jgi:hypothetical protein
MMMNFSMNYRKRAPISIIQVAQVMDNMRSMPRQVARVPVAKIVESHVMKPVVKDEKHEKHEIRENMENREKKIIIFTIGEEDEEKEDEKQEEETFSVPFLEEPVIETLSVVVLPPILEEQPKDNNDHQDSIEHVQQLHEVKKKKRRMKGVRK